MLVSISSLVNQFWKIVTRFRQLQFKFVSHSSWARDGKNNFVYWHSFSSKFQSNSSPRRKGPITLDEFEWQNNEFVRKNDEFDPTFLTRFNSDTDKIKWQLTNLNAESLNSIVKKRMWMTIWRNWNLDLNAVSFSGRNWMKRWRKWAGKPILCGVTLIFSPLLDCSCKVGFYPHTADKIKAIFVCYCLPLKRLGGGPSCPPLDYFRDNF